MGVKSIKTSLALDFVVIWREAARAATLVPALSVENRMPRHQTSSFAIMFSGAKALGFQTKRVDKTNILRVYCPISNIHDSSKVSTSKNCYHRWFELRGASFSV